MADALAPTTELEAINVMLTNIGEAPVNSLESGVGLDASTAQIVLKESSRHTQAIGWFWNSEHVRLSPDSSKNIILPLNTMKVRPIGQSSKYAYVYRAGKLYNREPFTNTYEFGSAVELEITYELPFNDLPETARRYITFVASRMFQERKMGVQSISQQNRNDEARANAVLRQEENHVARRNVGNSSMSMMRILDRTQMSFWRS